MTEKRIKIFLFNVNEAQVVKLVDTRDLKSLEGNFVLGSSPALGTKLSMKHKILISFGTRPEAIKMAMVAKAINDSDAFDLEICSTGQHDEMLKQVLALFSLKLITSLMFFQNQKT